MRSVFVFFLILFSSCANIGTLGGGPIDETPPKLLYTNLSLTNFNGTKILFTFDEFVALNSPDKNIQILPNHAKLNFTVSHKKLIIELDTLLNANTTYQIIIDGGIKDVNAGNAFEYNAIFSTGAFVDTGIILVQLENYTKNKNLKLCLSKSSGLDSFKSFASDYIFNVSKDRYIFKGLSETTRHLWLYTDENQDNTPDLYRPINFIASVKIDSAYQISPKEWLPPFKILKHETDLVYDKIFYTTQSDYALSLLENTKTNVRDYLYYTSDSAVLLSGRFTGQKIDTLGHINYNLDLKNIVQNSIRIIQSKKGYTLVCLIPQFYIETEKPEQLKQEIIYYENKPDTFFLKHKAQIDTFILTQIPILDQNKLSYLKININDSFDLLYDIIITNSKNETFLKSACNYYEDFLSPGQYKIEIKQRNSIYSLNPFIMQNDSPVIYSKSLYLKASWEEILNIIL